MLLSNYDLIFIGQTAPRQPAQIPQVTEMIVHKQEKEEIDDDEDETSHTEVIISGL